MSAEHLLWYTAVMAGVTYLIRVLPLVLFRKEIKSPFVKSFLFYIPYAVLGAMTIPAVFSATRSLVSACVGLAVAVVMAWHRKGLLPVAVAACAAVFVTEWLMAVI
ncbi:AzlD domain-containing protein [Pseudoramibacter sp.]|jgi:branched-subunit amino acid transport protein|uniref:AzlD domain-containing protein n=1 Tax=Pseudoramibacter sp. TaxID=2034862 RepID=UPI0025DD0865|nr:AzlD domain-containing protein [Pseudoramibacter sp.]MCH4072185.1 AzlD domain-containing protein [Pseudoramibacter sp.]MCH4105955.1 AzlD domain-containing protein [Pseudoramibacter sp.]